MRCPDEDHVRAIWPHVRPVLGQVLDPCAGSGAIVGVLARGLWKPEWISAHEEEIADCDRLSEIGLGEIVQGQWIAESHDHARPKIVISAPPTVWTRRVVDYVVGYGGAACLWLPLSLLTHDGYFTSRGAFLTTHMPSVYLSPRDTDGYAWFYWATSHDHAMRRPREAARLHMLHVGISNAIAGETRKKRKGKKR